MILKRLSGQRTPVRTRQGLGQSRTAGGKIGQSTLEPAIPFRLYGTSRSAGETASFCERDRQFEFRFLHQRVINEPGRANWPINSPVAQENRYLLANARASWVTAS